MKKIVGRKQTISKKQLEALNIMKRTEQLLIWDYIQKNIPKTFSNTSNEQENSKNISSHQIIKLSIITLGGQQKIYYYHNLLRMMTLEFFRIFLNNFSKDLYELITNAEDVEEDDGEGIFDKFRYSSSPETKKKYAKKIFDLLS